MSPKYSTASIMPIADPTKTCFGVWSFNTTRERGTGKRTTPHASAKQQKSVWFRVCALLSGMNVSHARKSLTMISLSVHPKRVLLPAIARSWSRASCKFNGTRGIVRKTASRNINMKNPHDITACPEGKPQE
mmetsp:Transcript_25588/g.71841  ORF Transcript_25588/g.71841 Transcript_25588/m.71841 type:complete len:132 (+) Transcript_25588:526-921(+)